MALVHLVTAVSSEMCLDRMLEMARSTDQGPHQLTDDPQRADLILFVENWKCNFLLDPVAAHPLMKQFREKIFCFCENDTIVARVPGIYASLPEKLRHPGWATTGPYLWMMRDAEVDFEDTEFVPDLLFSFVGSAYTNPIRKRLMQLQHPRAHLEDIGSKTEYMRYKATDQERRAFRHHYDLTIKRSKFSLCPPGMACSSVRFFETLRAGRVPVLMCDAYEPPPGPDWSTCTIKIPEREIESIPHQVEAMESEAAGMGRTGAKVYADWYSPQHFFTRVVDTCMELQKSSRPTRLHARLRMLNQLRQQPYFGNLQRMVRQRLRDRLTRPS